MNATSPSLARSAENTERHLRRVYVRERASGQRRDSQKDAVAEIRAAIRGEAS